jgi:phosphoglycolate phosphatase
MSDRAERRPHAILFDWDNTLVDTWPVIHAALNHTLLAFDKEAWTLDETRARVRRSMRDSFPNLFGDLWTAAADHFYEQFAARHLKALTARPGAADMLRSLQELGIYLGVVSNKNGGYLRAEAEKLGWDEYFGALVGASDASRDKPAREPVDLALAESGFEAGPGVWFAGDTDIDLECAVKAGCVPILVRPEPPEKSEFGPYAPSRHVADCQALCNLVHEL